MTVVLLLIAAINVAAFGAYAYDKFAAQSGRRRIPERTLLTLAVLGGAAGGLCAMYLMRHKTQTPIFKIGLPVLLIFQLVGLAYFASG